jgi:flagellar hook-length control protein FliK
MSNIGTNIKPQIASLAMRDLAKASVRKDGSVKGSASSKSDESTFSKALSQDKDISAQSRNKSDALPKSERPVEKISPSGEPRQRNEISDRKSRGEAAPAAEISKSEESKKSESVDREKALQVFLDKMQTQLGVPPEQIVEAFSKLELSDLALPAEDTIGKVIGELNLSAEDKEVAGGLYSEMLAMSAAASMSQYLQSKNETAQMEVLSPKEASRRELNKNIGAMSDSFFTQAKPTSAVSAQRAQAANAYGANAPRPTMTDISAANSAGQIEIPQSMELASAQQPMPLPVVPGNLQAVDVANMSPEQIMQNPMPMIQALEKELATLEQVAPNDPDLPMMKESLAQLKAAVSQSALNSPAIVPPKIDLSAMQAKAGMQAYMNAPIGTVTAQQDPSADLGSGSEDRGDGKRDLSQLDGMGQTNNQKTQVLNNKEFMINAPKANSADVQANVKELINQAQFLAKKGGGEMTVKMNPHGLGEVNLKVTQNNGQLNIEMVTSNDEAKKILEKGIGELKASLAEHKLHIEHIKIDSPKESSNQMSQQFDQENKQFQQRFLQDFRDQNSQFRREMFDIGTARTPGSNIQDSAANSATSTDPNSKRQAGRRLDMVA